MNEQFFDCLKRERDIRIKPKLRDGKTSFGYNPTLSDVTPFHTNKCLQIALEHFTRLLIPEEFSWISFSWCPSSILELSENIFFTIFTNLEQIKFRLDCNFDIGDRSEDWPHCARWVHVAWSPVGFSWEMKSPGGDSHIQRLGVLVVPKWVTYLFGRYPWLAYDVIGGHVGVLNNSEKVFWELGATIMLNASYVFLFFSTPTWPSDHVSANQE